MKDFKISEIIDYDNCNLLSPDVKIKKSKIKKAVRKQIEVPPKKSLVFLKPALVCAMLLILLIGSSAIVYAAVPDFREFLYEKFGFSLNHFQKIDESKTNNGITVTFKAAARDKVSAMIFLEVVNTNGSAFEDTAEINNLCLGIEEEIIGNITYTSERYLSTDKTTINYIINCQMKSDEQLISANLNISDFAKNKIIEEKQFAQSLETLIENSNGYEFKIADDLYHIMAQEDGSNLYLTVDMPKNQMNESEDVNYFSLLYLINEKTNEKYEPVSVYNYLEVDYGIQNEKTSQEERIQKRYVFEDFSFSDIENIRGYYSYIKTDLQKGDWSQKIKLEMNNQSVMETINQSLYNDQIKLDNAYFSLTGIIIEGECASAVQYTDTLLQLDTKIVLENAEIIDFGIPSISFDGNKFMLKYFYEVPQEVTDISKLIINTNEFIIKN